MIEINLIPDVKQELIRAQRTRSLVVSSSIFIGIIALGVVALLAAYVFLFQSVRSGLADEAIKKGSQQLAAVEDLSKILTLQNQLKKIDILNQDKKRESLLFDALAAVIPPSPNTVQVSTLSLDAETNSLVIEGETPSYDTLEVFKKTIDGAVLIYMQADETVTEDLAADISISDVSYGDSTTGAKVLRFTISFTYPDSLFSAKTPAYVIKLTNAGNVTDSFLGVPKSIFIDRGDE